MAELVQALMAEYEVSDATARETTQSFLTQCLAATVVQERPE